MLAFSSKQLLSLKKERFEVIPLLHFSSERSMVRKKLIWIPTESLVEPIKQNIPMSLGCCSNNLAVSTGLYIEIDKLMSLKMIVSISSLIIIVNKKSWLWIEL